MELPLQLGYFGRVVGVGVRRMGGATGKNNYRRLCFLSHETFSVPGHRHRDLRMCS
jgi:hypothetical protein